MTAVIRVFLYESYINYKEKLRTVKQERQQPVARPTTRETTSVYLMAIEAEI